MQRGQRIGNLVFNFDPPGGELVLERGQCRTDGLVQQHFIGELQRGIVFRRGPKVFEQAVDFFNL